MSLCGDVSAVLGACIRRGICILSWLGVMLTDVRVLDLHLVLLYKKQTVVSHE